MKCTLGARRTTASHYLQKLISQKGGEGLLVRLASYLVSTSGLLCLSTVWEGKLRRHSAASKVPRIALRYGRRVFACRTRKCQPRANKEHNNVSSRLSWCAIMPLLWSIRLHVMPRGSQSGHTHSTHHVESSTLRPDVVDKATAPCRSTQASTGERRR